MGASLSRASLSVSIVAVSVPFPEAPNRKGLLDVLLSDHINDPEPFLTAIMIMIVMVMITMVTVRMMLTPLVVFQLEVVPSWVATRMTPRQHLRYLTPG